MSIEEKTIENMLANHCAPVLFDRKPAALVGRRAMPKECTRLQLYRYGLLAERFIDGEGHVMFFIYRYKPLVQTLSKSCVRSALMSFGYPDVRECGVGSMLMELKKRFREPAGFPHEIGFFLGYPVEDVLGFMRGRSERCKYCGLWKVYGDVERAKKCFDEFARLKFRLTSALEKGESIQSVTGCSHRLLP